MSDNQLIVTVLDDKSVRLRSGMGGEVPGKIRVDKLYEDTVKIFVDWLKKGKLERDQEFKVLGAHLYYMLFNEDVLTFFLKALGGAKGERLSLQLSFGSGEKAAELSKLPWEYLYYPDREGSRGFFFATHFELAVSRFLPLEEPVVITPETGTLRILVVVSGPADQIPTASEEVISALEKLQEANPIKIKIFDKPTFESLPEKVAHFKPHVLHFIGHGRIDEKEGQIALLASDEQSSRWLNYWNFVRNFDDYKPPLVFVQMNPSTNEEFTSSLDRLAYELIRGKIQAVVAMQYPITNDAAIKFCRIFYPSLAKGEHIDSAVQAAREKGIADYSNRLFGAPVLYINSRDGIIKQLVEKKLAPFDRTGR
jgi:hypothetical protein